MISTAPAPTEIRQGKPYRILTDDNYLVQDCCATLLEKSGLKPDITTGFPIEHLVHLDHETSKALHIAARKKEAFCFRAFVRLRGNSLLPVNWTVIPGEEGFCWYGFPVLDRERIERRINELEQIVGSFHDLVFELDADGNFLDFWIQDPQKLFIHPSAFLGKNVVGILQEFFQPLSQKMVDCFLDAQQARASRGLEYQLPGWKEYYSCRFTPMLDPAGQIQGTLVIITDISNEKLLQHNLKQSEERYRDLFENANDIIYIVDMQNKVSSMNRKAEELLEFSEAEMIGKISHRFYAPEKLPAAISYGEKKRKGQADITRYESEFISKSGRRIPVEISSRLIYKDGIPVSVHVTARDISAEKESQNELARSEARFRFLSEYGRDVVCLHRPNGDFLYVSPSAKTLLGYEPEDLTTQSPYQFIHSEDVDDVIRMILETNWENAEIPSFQFRFVKKDGSLIWLESVTKPILEDNEIVYFQTNSRDITDRKMDEQLLVEKDRLSSALARASTILLENSSLKEGLELSFPILGAALQAESLFVLKYTDHKPGLFHIWSKNYRLSLTEKHQVFRKANSFLSRINPCKAGTIIEFQLETEEATEVRDLFEILHYKSLALTPITTVEGCWGILGCAQKEHPRTWSVNVTDTFKIFASSICSILNKNLRDLQLKESEERFKALFRNSLDLVFVTDQTGCITYVTPSLQQILGYEEEEILNTFCHELVHPEERNRFDKALKNLAIGHQPGLLLPLRLLHHNGRWIWMELKGQNRFSNPNINGIILSLRDITEYIEIEKTLKQYSDKVTGMLNSITDGFIALDKNFDITMFNPVAQELLMHNDQLTIGNKAWNLLPRAEESITYAALNKAVRENTTVRFEQYVQSLNRWFDGTAFPYHEGLFVYFKDATERKHHEKLLQLEKEVLEMHTGSAESLPAITEHLLSGLERFSEEMRCAVYLVKPNLREVTCLAAPSLPERFFNFVESTPLDRDSTGCSKSILERQQVIISDLSKSELSETIKNGAASLGINASLSMPIIGSTNEILGSFAVYFSVAREPGEAELAMFSRANHILTMIIENKQGAEKIRISNERYLLATRAANEAIWDWDAEEEVSFWGEGFNTLFGYPAGFYKGNTMNWEDKIHPDDKERVLRNISHFTSGERKGLYTEEYRFLKADGVYAYVIDKGYCLYDHHGKVIRMIGSCEDITERKKMQEQLLQQEIEKQQQIARAVVDVQESERAEIGKELHDNINQLLTTAKLFLEVAEEDEGQRRQLIRRSADTILGAINEIRKISRSLMPASISDLGLISSINDLVQNIGVARKLSVDFLHDELLDTTLDSKQKLMLFRIIQEQVNNVIKHAKASKLRISISTHPNFTRLEIWDNGVGFDPEHAKMKDGVGISNILSRAAIFNAPVQLNTSPGKGCQLIIDLPNKLNNHKANV